MFDKEIFAIKDDFTLNGIKASRIFIAAEIILNGKETSVGWGNDYDTIRYYAGLLTGNQETRDELTMKQFELTKKLFSDKNEWRKLEAIANKLLEKKTLTYDEIKNIYTT